MRNKILPQLILLMSFVSSVAFAEDFNSSLLEQTFRPSEPKTLRLKTNVLPWAIAVPNIGAEITLGKQWSASVDLWYCPWKISESHSLKTVAILPEGRWWFHTNSKGHFLNLHLTVAWYNARWNDYRYQDVDRPLLGGGIGYGYLLEFNRKWGMEFNVGVGVAQTRYNRFYNIPNGALADTRQTFYWGIDRIGVSFFLNLADL